MEDATVHGYTGQDVAEHSAGHGIDLLMVKQTEAKKGFVLLPRRWAVKRSFGSAARFRQLAQDYERLSETLVGLHYATYVCLILVTLFLYSPWVHNRLERNHRPCF